MAHKYTSAHPEIQQVDAPVAMPHLLQGLGLGFGLSVQRQATESHLSAEPGWGLPASPFEKQNWWDAPAEPMVAEPW
ncbi:MAG: hypothetical protein HC812_17975 [Leptolyngbya sp. RL_3_1]|nr:hypothetical protein [Leptolyngbya sp. RL_3_1]